MNLSKEEKRMLREVVVFYRHHHMSASNPQQKDIDAILDKIQRDINRPMSDGGDCATDCPCSCHGAERSVQSDV